MPHKVDPDVQAVRNALSVQHKVGKAIEVPVFALVDGGNNVLAVALTADELKPELQKLIGAVIVGILPGVMTLPLVTK